MHAERVQKYKIYNIIFYEHTYTLRHLIDVTRMRTKL